MRHFYLALVAACAALMIAPSARADDSKPPSIANVKASSKGGSTSIEAKITDETGVLQALVYSRKGGGKWSEQQMTKEEYGDGFKASISGADEYYIQATDLLGNGPASFGSASKPMPLGGGKSGKTAVAAAEPPPPPPAEPPPSREPKPKRVKPEPSVMAGSTHHEPRAHHASSTPPPPVIQHRKPGSALNDGQQFTLRITIKADAGLKVAALYARPTGTAAWKVTVPLKHVDGDSYAVEIPETLAHGEVEYIILAKDNAGQQVQMGDGSASTPYQVTFKPPGGGAASAAAARPASTGTAQPFAISHASPFRIEPRRAFLLRAQVSPNNLENITEAQAGEAEAKVLSASAKVLYRGQDTADQVMDMVADPTGGLGGFVAEMPAQFDGEVIYYQVVACAGDECAIDTGSKKRWHFIRISATPGDAPPAIDAVSSKAPANLPD